VGKLFFLCFAGCCFSIAVWGQIPRTGQPVSNLRKRVISTQSTSVQLDTLSLLPGSVYIPGISSEWYTVDDINATLYWKQKPPADSIVIQYRVFSTRLNAVTRHISYDSVINYFVDRKPYTFNETAFGQTDRFFDFGNLNYSGSFGRGIAFGNSQDAVVTSSLNLQLNGFLADSIEIVAAITDNNIPIQPDGTTQQLNEFDRIFLQFKKKSWSLSLGDIDLRQNKSYFLNFYKRLQGIAFETTSQLTPHTSNTSVLSGSIAKGKFTRNIIQGQEGNQGPYRLRGANNEFYFVLLANTERVFIDGELLQRGEDRDYVINYNTAEIAFTPKRMITKDSRIQVEFEYADRNYLNANLYFSNLTNFNNKLRLTVSAFSNSDAKSSPLNQSLDPSQKIFLKNLGDSINNAFYKVATPDTFALGKILYKKIDTIYGGNLHDSVYVYSNNPDSARYTLSFVDVGFGKGDYLPDFNGANGKVYKWVAPVGGIKQGQFEAAIFLVTPKKQQLVSVLADYDISKNTNLSTELAYSNYDVNTFSNLDKGDNKAYAAKVKLTHLSTLGGKANNKLTTDGGIEYSDARFKPLERLRTVEFLRDWGLPYTVDAANEMILTAGGTLDNKNGKLRYQFTDYKRGSDFNGVRNNISQNQLIQGWQLNNQISLSNTNSTVERGFFFRPFIDISKKLSHFHNYTVGAAYSLEHSEVRSKQADSVNATSFSFRTIQVSLRSSPGKPNKWGISYTTRTNSYPFGKNLATSDISHNVNLNGELMKNEHHQFRWNITYRKLNILNSAVTTQKADQSLLARGEYQTNLAKGMITGNLLYEAGSGQEQKRDFAYLEVPAGQGQYTWIDYNNNGIQELNEFEFAVFKDQAKYIRIFTPSNLFVKANYNTFNYSLNVNPGIVIDPRSAAGMKKFLSKLTLLSSLQIAKKELATGIVQLNPFKIPLNDTSLINLNAVYVNTISFNRFSTRWSIDLNNTRNSGKTLLTYGLESRQLNEWKSTARVNPSKAWQVELTARKGNNQLSTANAKFDNRNFNLATWSLEPKIRFTRGTTFGISAGYKYGEKNNRWGDLEKFSSSGVNAEVNYRILQSGSVTSRFNYTNISFSPLANVNSTVGYNMLEGLLPGKNFLWNLELTKRLSNNLEVNIQYEGRKPGEARTVHIGRASVRAIF
jgi:hypothetical protein